MNREDWSPPFEHFPAWPCPNCNNGVLKLEYKLKIELETAVSTSRRALEYWDPDMVEGRYSCFLRCNRASCHDVVSMCGSYSVESRYYGPEEGEEYLEVYTPMMACPELPIIQIHGRCPRRVSKSLQSAFAAYWSDPNAAGMHIRAAVEALLTEFRIIRYQTKKGKRRRISLHERIIILSSRNNDASECLLAIKFLGNVGSHDGTVNLSHKDVLDALELFDHVIDLLIVKRTEKIKKVAKQITKKKGPRKHI